MTATLNWLTFMKALLPIMQPLLVMRCTQTWLLLPGNLTSSVQILPFEQNNKAPCCSLSFLITTLYKTLYWTTEKKLAFIKWLRCVLCSNAHQWSRTWGILKKKKRFVMGADEQGATVWCQCCCTQGQHGNLTGSFTVVKLVSHRSLGDCGPHVQLDGIILSCCR